MKKFQGALLILCLALSLPAAALTLKDAQAQGLVGEANSGYIAVIRAEEGVDKLVAKVNHARRKKYAEIAKRNNISVEQVAARAAEKLEARLQKGQYYENAQGNWVRK